MASLGSLVYEDQFLCAICLDVFTHPVSTPCGHNFCQDCIQGYWRSAGTSQCPMCKQKFFRKPDLKVNTFISEMADQYRRSVEERTSDVEDEPSAQPPVQLGEVWCDVCAGKQVQAVRSCLECLASYCQAHLEPHQILPTFKKHHLMDPVMNMRDRVCRKHERLLELFCRTDQTYTCLLCAKKNHRSHQTVPLENESGERRAELEAMEAEVRRMIEGRLAKVAEIKHALLLSRENADREMENSLQVFTALLRCVQRGLTEVAELIEKKQREVERKAEELIKELEEETVELERRSTELETLCHTEDHLHFLHSIQSLSTPPVTKDWSETSLKTPVYVGDVRRAVRRAGSALKETLETEVRQLCETELQRVRQYAVDVTLDPDTAHPKLELSKDRRQVLHGDLALSSPDDPERFYPGLSVLGKEGFSSGRLYYEVLVKGKTEWDIGVGRESVNRKGGNMLNPDGGYWTLGLRNGREYWALACPPIPLPLPEKPQRVGVYVDVERGQVSFYDVETRCHVYTFTGCSFGERIFPYFNPRRNHSGVNSAPLVITPVTSIT